MKLNFDFTLTNLDGSALKDEEGVELNAGRTAASLIMKSVETGMDSMEKFDWAQQLYKTGKIDLDKAGQAKFKKVIENIPNVWLIVRGQIMEVLEKRQDELKPEN